MKKRVFYSLLLACLMIPVLWAGNIYGAHLVEVDLEYYEKKFYSQNGEDGVTKAIFKCIGSTSKQFVEFGVEDGSECNTRYFREHLGWSGLMMDSEHENQGINLQREMITAENIVGLFQKYQVPLEFDLLSIDIDSNDFYVWNAVLQQYRPRVVIIEYNASHLPHEDKVVVYNPKARWDQSNYFGASILAYYKLGCRYGYSLVYADKRGVNLFFIRNDVLENCPYVFKNINSVEKIYKPPGYGRAPDGGHLSDPLNREYIRAEDVLR